MNISVSTYSYYSLIKNNQISTDGILKHCKECGADAVEFVDFVDFKDLGSDKMIQHADELRNKAELYGLKISALATGADFLNKDPLLEVQRLKRMVDVAHHLGCSYMRHDITVGYPSDSSKYCSYDSVVADLSVYIKEVSEYAEQFGITTMSENHGFYSQDSERVEKLVNVVNRHNFRLLCDIGNFTCADENPSLAVARIAPYVVYVHVKDFIMKPYYSSDPGEGSFRSRAGNYLIGTIIGHGNVPVEQCLYTLKRAGYNGFYSIEFEGLESPLDGVRIGISNLKSYLKGGNI
jgi:sugar phosphate isomerase/epimerase